jgi:hypothetical protein
VGVYFLGRGTNRRLWAAQQPEASFVGDVFRQSTSDGSTQPSPPNLENGTYVQQQQQIGETYTNHGATENIHKYLQQHKSSKFINYSLFHKM